MPTLTRPFGRLALVGTLATGVVAALVGATAAPAVAAPGSDVDSQTSSVAIDVGNGLTANVTPATGVVQLETPAAGATWDSAMPARDGVGLGPGWSWGNASARIMGGIFVYVPGMGEYEASQVEWSGLIGYPGDDIQFAQIPGKLPARGDIPAQDYEFTLHHLTTGTVDYFAPLGNVIASIDGTGGRTDWISTPVRSDQLERIVDAAGATTTIDYSPDLVTITAPDGQVTMLDSSFGRITKLTTPAGTSDFTPLNGLISRIVSKTTSGDTVTGFSWDQTKTKVGSVTHIVRNGEIVYPKH